MVHRLINWTETVPCGTFSTIIKDYAIIADVGKDLEPLQKDEEPHWEDLSHPKVSSSFFKHLFNCVLFAGAVYHIHPDLNALPKPLFFWNAFVQCPEVNIRSPRDLDELENCITISGIFAPV